MRSPTALASLLSLLTSTMAACGTASSGSVLDEDASSDAKVATPGEHDASDERHTDAADMQPDAASDAPPGDSGNPLSIRRPFLVGSSMRSARARKRGDWAGAAAPSGAALDPTTRRRLAEVWLADALEEHASIAAFARFTMLLLSVGAPPNLVEWSQRASIDEVRHAQQCFALAVRYGAEPRGPAALDLRGAVHPMSLAEIAALTAEEGCVGETLGAVLAAEQRDRAVDPEVRRVLAAIAADEERHAALAWGFVRWAAMRGGDTVREAVARAAERAIAATLAMDVRRYADVDVDAWHAHGRVTCAEARAAAAEAIAAVVRPSLLLV